MLIPGAFVLTTYSVYAAYPVFDAQNVAKTIKVIENTAKQIEKLNEQVNLAKKHLSIVTQSMKDISDNAKKVLSAVDGTRNAVDGVIKNTQSSFKGLLSPIKDIQNVAKETEEKWNKTFMSLADLNPKNLTYSTLQGSNSYINAQVQQNNKEAVTETQAIMAGLAQAEDELKQLREQARHTEGQRDLAKINAEINAVTARIEGFNSKLTAIQVTNQNMESQAKQQQDANRAEYNFAAAKRFSESVVNMKGSMDDLPNGYESRSQLMKSAWK
ncbi:MAG: hypothetical protein HXP08_04315 [Veillonella dispar]|nr:hypothetical protein [Veillonella dispar]